MFFINVYSSHKTVFCLFNQSIVGENNSEPHMKTVKEKNSTMFSKTDSTPFTNVLMQLSL
jgi:hypothetical protein